MGIIDFDNVSYRTDKCDILKNISFSVNEGTVHALIGFNGAGKTSILRILLGLTVKYDGDIRIMDSDNLNIQRKNLGSVMDSVSPDGNKTGVAYLHNVCEMLGISNKKYENELLKKVGIGDKETANKKIRKYSLGMKRRLMIACALAGNPRILVLDEPFNGIDKQGMNELKLLLRNLKSDSITVLITSHIIDELLKVADVFTVITDGELSETITLETLKAINNLKFSVTPENSEQFIEKLKELNSDLVCIPSTDNSVEIIGKINDDCINQIKSTGYKGYIHSLSTSEEDYLFWKMSRIQR